MATEARGPKLELDKLPRKGKVRVPGDFGNVEVTKKAIRKTGDLLTFARKEFENARDPLVA